MVPRYSRPEMAAIWAPINRYRIWFEIEALAAEGMAMVVRQDTAGWRHASMGGRGSVRFMWV